MADLDIYEQAQSLPQQGGMQMPAAQPEAPQAPQPGPVAPPYQERNFWGRMADRFHDNVQLRRQSKVDAHIKAEREYYDTVTGKLEEAMLEDDETIRQTAIDSVLSSVEKQQKKPVSKEFRKWLTASPDQAMEMLTNVRKQGQDPRIVFEAASNPLLFAHGLLAMGRAKRELAARQTRGDGGASPAGAAAGSPAQEPELLAGPATESPAAAPTATAPEGRQLAPELKGEVDRLEQQSTALSVRINSLARLGRPEAEISPLRQEKSAIDGKVRDARLGGPTSADTESAKLGEQPVPQADLSQAVDAAKRAGRNDIAARFVPGMRRKAYDALVGQLTGPTQISPSGSAPTDSSASPMQPAAASSPYSLDQSTPNPARLGGMTASPARATTPGTGRTLIQTPAETETEKHAIARREQKLPDDLMRDPSVLKMGISTQGQLEDGLANGTIRLLDLPEKARVLAVAGKMGESAVKDFEGIKEVGTSARNLNKYYDVLAASAGNAGPRGPWLTPVREVLNNFANLLAIKDPHGQSNLQLMNAVSMKLVPELTKQFKGSQSDREFMAGIASAPSTYNSEKGFATLIMVGRELNKISLEQDIQARRWVNQYGDVARTDSKGRDFQTAFDESLESFNAKAGDLQTRVARAMKLKPSELLKPR